LRVHVNFQKLKELQWHELAARFTLGGAATVITSLIGHGFGPKIGGLFLAFSAIFPLSATLLEKHQREEKHRAGIASTSRGRLAAALDARGAVMGSLAGLAFAVSAWQLIPITGLYPALTGALLVWIFVAISLWYVRKRHPWSRPAARTASSADTNSSRRRLERGRAMRILRAMHHHHGRRLMSVSSSLKQMTNTATRMLKTGNEAGESTDILKTLKQEHDEVKHLLSRLVKSDTAAERKSLVKQIKKALVPHTKAEEKVVYDAVIAVRDKQVQQDGYEGYLEHEWAAKTLQRLEGISNANSPEHHAAAKVLKELVEHHIQEEESSVWTDVRERFDDAQRLAMNRTFLAAKQRVKIH